MQFTASPPGGATSVSVPVICTFLRFGFGNEDSTVLLKPRKTKTSSVNGRSAYQSTLYSSLVFFFYFMNAVQRVRI